jgi:hypothetical protein
MRIKIKIRIKIKKGKDKGGLNFNPIPATLGL